MPLLWLADPLGGVVVWGSAGIVAWAIIAAFVGSLLGILRQLGNPIARRSPQVTRPELRHSARVKMSMHSSPPHRS